MIKTVFLVYDDYNSKLYEPCEGVNTLTTVAKDNMILEIMEDDDNEQTV